MSEPLEVEIGKRTEAMLEKLCDMLRCMIPQDAPPEPQKGSIEYVTCQVGYALVNSIDGHSVAVQNVADAIKNHVLAVRDIGLELRLPK